MKSSLLQPIEKGASRTQGALRAPHVLVVEDETLIRETLGLALQEQGYRVCAVADGKTALNLICTDQRQESFDLVILDLILPQVSGLDVCQALYQSEMSVSRIGSRLRRLLVAVNLE
ncbi:MAG TPA: response regulator [Candidatus Sericytochromatia bacterium]